MENLIKKEILLYDFHYNLQNQVCSFYKKNNKLNIYYKVKIYKENDIDITKSDYNDILALNELDDKKFSPVILYYKNNKCIALRQKASNIIYCVF